MFAVPATIVYLCMYELARTYRRVLGDPDVNSFIHVLAGSSSEFVSNVFWCPMEVIKSRQQAKAYVAHAGKYTKLNAHSSCDELQEGEGELDLEDRDSRLSDI